MKILMLHRQQSAVGSYRTWVPARYLMSKGHEVTYWEDAPYRHKIGRDKDARHKWLMDHQGEFDIIWVDRAMDEQELGEFAGLRHYSPDARMIVDFDDDFTNIPHWNTAHKGFLPGQPLREYGLMHLALSEMATVSTKVLAKRFRHLTHRIMPLLNCIDPADWDNLPVCPDRAKDPHLRILYGGASGHYGDLDEAREGIQAVLDKPPCPIRLICFGALPGWLHEASRTYPGRVISQPWVPFSYYPRAVAWGGFDVAIAPLADHIFNEAKSNIKWLEAGIQGISFLCSDVGPYKAIPSEAAIKVDNTSAQWAQGLREMLKDANLRKRLRTRANEIVRRDWTVDQMGQQWENAIEEACKRPRIQSAEDARLPARSG